MKFSKPYTLRWWLSKLVAAELTLNKFSKPFEYEQYNRYEVLADWIRERIIKKYGE